MPLKQSLVAVPCPAPLSLSLLGNGNGIAAVALPLIVPQVERTAGAVRGRVFGVKTAPLMIAAPAGTGPAGVTADHGPPVLAGAGVRNLVLPAVVMSRALRDLEPKELSHAQR
ncbi:hypothetical protein ABZ234_15225 [Nocardiopsis sp. NPDC006198]|uniref:hypothetical protein n=1 Tax=Nocardiopsis sp. NPDC006198 TaxID=3154472 RepID=UPI0033ADDA7C